MLVIRLSRKGKKKQPVYRIIISEKRKDTQGDYLESLGFYDPRRKEVKLNKERIKYWLSKGAQLSATVNNLFISQGVIEGRKIKKGRLKKKTKNKKEEKAPEEKKAETSTEEEKQTSESENKEKKAES